MSDSYILKIGASGSEVVIAGQLDGTMTLGGTPVMITNKASGGFIEVLPDFLAGKQVVFSTTFTASDEVAQKTLKEAVENGTLIAGNIVSGVGAEEWQCDTWSVTGRSDSSAVQGGVSIMSLTFSTSGTYVYTPSSV